MSLQFSRSAEEPCSVSICVCTFKRPLLLDALLTGIQQQEIEGVCVEVIVTDNDPGKSADSVLDSWSSKMRFPLIRLNEPNPNISLARNLCVRSASGQWIAFVDDDEVPHPTWLANLLTTQRKFSADVVFGPVLPLLPRSTPRWILEGNYFDRPRHETGTVVSLHDARTGNAIVRRKLLCQKLGPFDPAFGQTGGGDTVLFSQLLNAGARMIWCDDAPVDEAVQESRLTLAWLLRRSFRSGQSWLFAKAHSSALLSKTTKLGIVFLSARAIGYSVPAALALSFVSKARAVRRLRSAAYNFGILSAIFGHRYFEYAPK